MVLKKGMVGLMLAGLLVSTGCSQLPVRPVVDKNPAVKAASIKEAAWKQRQQYLARKPVWNLNSKIALRFRADHWTFGLSWAQKAAQQYIMQINNPLTGAVVAKLTSNKAGVSLLSDDGKVYRDNDEERLLQRQSGVILPLKGMQHWVRGLSSPLYKVDKLVLDANGRPQVLMQAGWKIEYSRYLNPTFKAMPRKVVITRTKDSVYLKMIAKKWQGI